MENPFMPDSRIDQKDEKLVALAVKGQRQALETLIKKHLQWIYNIALRMVWHPQDAEDVTQEVLIKIITKLGAFKGQSAFRTWVYRILTNHVLNMQQKRMEVHFISFEHYGQAIDETPDLDLPDPAALPVDLSVIIEETKINCMMGMLLCLDRKQRLTFILGEIIGVDHNVGSEIFQISKASFRQNLSRARRKLYQFMQQKCGLIREENACHCAYKTRAMMESGAVNPRKLLFNTNYLNRVKEISIRKIDQLENILDTKCRDLFLTHPFQNAPDFVKKLRDILDSPDFQDLLN